MFKKLIIALALSTVCASSAFADYIYVGPTALINTTTASNSNYRDLSPRLSLGYNYEMDTGFDVAGEITVDLLSLNISNNEQGSAPSAKVSRTFGASLIPSTMINDEVRGFVRLGVVNSKFEGPSSTASGGQVGI